MNWFKKWILQRAAKIEEETKATDKPNLQRVVLEEADKYRDSKEPWVTIIGDTISEDGIQIALDWNDAFVKYLKAQGVTGSDETEVVQHWLAMISKQASEKLSQHFNDTEGKISQYQ